MSIRIEATNAPVGAIVSGIDLAGEVAEPELTQILDSLWRSNVLIFPGQDFDAAAHEAFLLRFGQLEEVRTAPEDGARTRYVMYVANRPVDGKEGILPDGEMHFHTDQCYYQIPARITSLFAMEIPQRGGNTLFLDACAAYEALSSETKSRLRGLSAEHVYDYSGSPTLRSDTLDPNAPRFIHPAVIRHPVSGRRSLYVNRLMTRRLVGLDAQESEALLDELFSHMEQDCFIYEHVWEPGDLLMWDNLCTMHARTDFDKSERRVLRRVTVRGEQPQAAV